MQGNPFMKWGAHLLCVVCASGYDDKGQLLWRVRRDEDGGQLSGSRAIAKAGVEVHVLPCRMQIQARFEWDGSLPCLLYCPLREGIGPLCCKNATSIQGDFSKTLESLNKSRGWKWDLRDFNSRPSYQGNKSSHRQSSHYHVKGLDDIEVPIFRWCLLWISLW